MEAAMSDGSRSDRISFLSGPLPPSFQLRIVVIEGGQSRAYDDAEWRDAIVVVERGQVDIRCADGDLRCFTRGDILFLEGLSVATLRNPGIEPVVLSAVSRRITTAGG
jgi:glyoxylate utilization-related uncharacterized protein